jgi:hypothetical protein
MIHIAARQHSIEDAARLGVVAGGGNDGGQRSLRTDVGLKRPSTASWWCSKVAKRFAA